MSENPADVEAMRAELAALRQRNAELEQRLAELGARAEVSERLATIVEGASDFIGVSAPDGRVLFVNSAGRQMAGYGPDDDISAMRTLDIIAERARPVITNVGREAAIRLGSWQGEVVMRRRDGSELPISIRITIHRGPDGAPIFSSAIMRDITAEKKIADELRAAEERLRHLLRSSPIVIYTARADGAYGITFVSDSVTEVLGYAPAAFMESARFWAEHIHPDDRDRVLTQLTEVFERGQSSYEYRFLDSSGRYRWMLDQHKLVLDGAGQPIEIVGSILDITDRQEAERLVMELSTPLIPVSDRVLVMPLIGRMDHRRGEQARATLLEGIAKTRASVAILDITGVDRVDEHVAAGLLEAARGVKLLGAEAVITGIRPEVAQALVQMGADLGQIVTLGSLQAGIAYAMRQR